MKVSIDTLYTIIGELHVRLAVTQAALAEAEAELAAKSEAGLEAQPD